MASRSSAKLMMLAIKSLAVSAYLLTPSPFLPRAAVAPRGSGRAKTSPAKKKSSRRARKQKTSPLRSSRHSTPTARGAPGGGDDRIDEQGHAKAPIAVSDGGQSL